MGRRTIDSLVARWSVGRAKGPAVACAQAIPVPGSDGACFATGQDKSDVSAELGTGRGVFVALVDVRGAARPGSAALIDQLARTYDEIPPDVDRLVALRATLDRGLAAFVAAQPAASDAPAHASILVAALQHGRLAAVNSGDCRAYHVRASGRIDRLRLEPSAQRDVEPGDSLILCSAAVTAKLEEVDLALAAYSRNPADAARHLTSTAQQRGAQGAVLLVVYGPGRSLRETVFGRSNTSSA